MKSDFVIVRLLNNGCAWIITEDREIEVSRSHGESMILAARRKYQKEFWSRLEHGAEQYIFN